jgi:hypothetical protein
VTCVALTGATRSFEPGHASREQVPNTTTGDITQSQSSMPEVWDRLQPAFFFYRLQTFSHFM